MEHNETGVIRLHAFGRIVARQTVKHLGTMTPAGRGTLMTVAVTIPAIGNVTSTPGFFPRDYLLHGGLIGSTCSANPSG